MMTAASIPFIAPADSAQAVASVYTASLLVTLPLVAAIGAALFLRRASGEARVLVWRSVLVTLLLVFVGRQLPLHWMAWVVPSSLATPLVALGRVQVTSAGEIGGSGGTLVTAVFLGYLVGVALVVVPTALAAFKMRRIAGRGRLLSSPEWTRALDEARAVFGIRRDVRLVATAEVTVPMTWGWLRPVIAIPLDGLEWDDAQRQVVLLHEMAHVRAADWSFAMLGRLACALYWFHPAVWFAARAMREDCEHASDDRVIRSGVRRSDYAELLIGAADRFLSLEPALALSRRSGLRGRLASILDSSRDIRPLARGWAIAAAASTTLVAGPMSVVQLAPTRDVLTTLMADSRWESRAYAVIGLARRPDSVAVALSAAERDPSPRVRAWARYALNQGDVAQLRKILHQ